MANRLDYAAALAAHNRERTGRGAYMDWRDEVLVRHLDFHHKLDIRAVNARLGAAALEPRKLSARLQYLALRGWLENRGGHGGAARWHATAEARPFLRAPERLPSRPERRRTRAAAPGAAGNALEERAAPRRPDVMNRPPLRGGGMVAARAGAEDFLRVPSRGARC